DLGHASLLDQLAVAVEDLDRLVGLHPAGKNAAGDDAAKIGIGLEDRSQHAEWTILDLRRRHVADDEIEQGCHTLVLWACRVGRHPTLLGRAIKEREIKL